MLSMERKTLSDIRDTALALLKKFYGYDSFRPLQDEIIERVLKGGDVLVLMPTGGGKSVCFQIPALMMEGCTIVVSPLLSLMKDQVDSLYANGIPAAAINSMQSETVNREVVEKVFEGKIKLLYISPERLLSEINQWSSRLNVSMIAVDEAHCISQWGHDFRPEYTQLSVLKQYFPNIPFMALTATADKLTRDDIVKQLGMVDAKMFISSFDRPNISLNVIANYNEKEKLRKILEFISEHPGQSGIVYCLSRVNTEKVADFLSNEGYDAVSYHAGMSNKERQLVQQRFLNDEIDIICATIAFGMGIDKSNIRWVVHFNMPKNVECYYQEIGRAGRDGLPADTLMFYSYSDVAMLTHFVEESGQLEINREKLKRMQEYAEASVCRRRMLLSYFNERYDHDCGKCDVCDNPPERFDGTQLCQMAVSASVRTGQTLGMTMLINVLRGTRLAALSEKGFDKIKTFGVGANMSHNSWSRYILQMIQLGIFEIAYNEGNHLKVTSYGWDVVKGIVPPVMMSRIIFDNHRHMTENGMFGKRNAVSPKQKLIDDLKAARLLISKQEKVPPYIIFSDKVISDIAEMLPVTVDEFAAVPGVGEKKVVRFSKTFISLVRKYKGMPASVAGFSDTITLFLLKKGYDIDGIAILRGLKRNTICGHIAKLIQLRKFSDYADIISKDEYETIISKWKSGLDLRDGKGLFDPDFVPIAIAIYRINGN